MISKSALSFILFLKILTLWEIEYAEIFSKCYICNTHLQKINDWGHDILRLFQKNEKTFLK